MDKKLEQAFLLSKKMHKGQTDKAGKDYFKGHILTVFKDVYKRTGGDTDSCIVALLHDIVEDTDVTLEQIEKEFGPKIATAVDLVTKKEGLEYDDYINRIKKNPLSRVVKLADMTHNSDITRLNNPTKKDIERTEKYKKYIEKLS